jgi:putative glutamine amidotransferase
MKRYWMPTGDWPIGTGYKHAHSLMSLFGLSEGTSESYDLLLLPGGADIGQRPQRDSMELTALEEALSEGKNIFGICRGMQLMLYASGVRIIDHIPDVTTAIEHRTLTGNWTGQSGWHRTSKGLLVNSRHHQGAIENLGHWEVVDTAEDGIVEAVRSSKQYGVQWHPEHPEMRETPALRWLESELKKHDII